MTADEFFNELARLSSVAAIQTFIQTHLLVAPPVTQPALTVLAHVDMCANKALRPGSKNRAHTPQAKQLRAWINLLRYVVDEQDKLKVVVRALNDFYQVGQPNLAISKSWRDTLLRIHDLPTLAKINRQAELQLLRYSDQMTLEVAYLFTQLQGAMTLEHARDLLSRAANLVPNPMHGVAHILPNHALHRFNSNCGEGMALATEVH